MTRGQEVEPINPYQSPEHPAEESVAPTVSRPQRRPNRFADAFVVGSWLFGRNWLAVTIIVLIVFLPIDAFVKYQQAFVLDPSDALAAYRVNSLMNLLFGVIGLGAIVAVGAGHWQTGRTPGLGAAFSASFSQWGRLAIGNFLGGLLTLLGLLLLVVPGVFIAACMIYLYPIYIVERPGLIDGIKRGFAVGQLHPWFSLALMLSVTTIQIMAGIAVAGLFEGLRFAGLPDAALWVATFLLGIARNVLSAWMLLVITAALLRMREEEQEEEQRRREAATVVNPTSDAM